MNIGSKTSSLNQPGTHKTVAIPQRRLLKPRHMRMSKVLRSKIRRARYLLCLLFSLVVADGIISNFIVQSGLGREGNPFIQSIVGQTSFIFLKFSAAFVSALILWKVQRQHTRLGLVSIIFFIILYTVILWWNLTSWFITQHDIQIFLLAVVAGSSSPHTFMTPQIPVCCIPVITI